MGVINPHTSMIFHDPNSKDMNQFRQVNSLEKTQLIKHYLELWKGQQLHVVNVLSGEVRVWEMSKDPWGKPTRHARVNTIHLLFGNWRIASQEDIDRQNAKDKAKAELAARIEAQKAATKANIMFSELTKASQSIQDFARLSELTKQAEERKAAEQAQAQAPAAPAVVATEEEKKKGKKS